ncbi:AAA family ATPase [Alteromonas genovensis]|uniref:DNA 3'-5' helicase II n=1 Tax=Alteromonas genovensis TaxID=471225 RepID=A0A6N9TF49_9ALTE|nr:NERD domain-containing protein [Alteromonas genovensis]NDW15790.1 AAA family ATPase [Alteromonas genovensis]
MAVLYPEWQVINCLRVKPEEGEMHLLKALEEKLDDNYEIFFNSFLDGDRPDIVILKKGAGAFIVEVKDWNLSNFSVDANNTWRIESTVKSSPHQQVFTYKKNMYDLHIPLLGLREVINSNFYNLIGVYVYFHKANRESLSGFYHEAISVASGQINQTNHARSELTTFEYEKRVDHWSKQQKRLNRDLNMSIGFDMIDKLVNKLKKISSHILFTDDIYDDLKRRLMPPEFIKSQAEKINFDKKQLPLTYSKAALSKVKGVAGCGKTTILAQRAINALSRHGEQVLILTYNITIRHYIRDAISRLYGKKVAQEIEIIHYHAFIKSQMNEHNISFSEEMKRFKGTEEEKISKVFKSSTLFEDVDVTKYETILLDEVQDYEPDWIKVIRNNFLEVEGEMVLFGDQSQNIYERDDSKRESSLVNGFGTWEKLKKSYRSDINTPLVRLFSKFQTTFLVDKYKDSEIFECSMEQSGLDFNSEVLITKTIPDQFDSKEIAKVINSLIRQEKFHPNDVAIVASQVDPLFKINNEILTREKTKIMFETEEEIESLKQQNRYNNKSIEKLRRRKKTFFFQNSGLIKISTIHSFKGLEAETVFLIIQPQDTPEVVYTGITRAKTNLIILNCKSSQFTDFFEKTIT